MTSPICTVRILPILLAVLACVGGVMVPLVDSLVRPVRGYLAMRRYDRQLLPLWRELVTQLPEISLSSAGRALHTPGSGWDPQARLYRRWVEIRDGLLLLQPFRAEHDDPVMDGSAAARREAHAVRRALTALADGASPGRPSAVSTVVGPSDFMEDVQWLAAVSTSLAEDSESRTRC